MEGKVNSKMKDSMILAGSLIRLGELGIITNTELDAVLNLPKETQDMGGKEIMAYLSKTGAGEGVGYAFFLKFFLEGTLQNPAFDDELKLLMVEMYSNFEAGAQAINQHA